MSLLARFFRLFTWILFVNILWGVSELHGQYVRRERFPTEKERRTHYALDDWVTYQKSWNFSSAVVGVHYLYIGTHDGGILRYHIYDNYWDYPFTTSNGLPSNNILNLAYDKKTSFLWAKTPRGIAAFNPASQEWMRKSDYPYLHFDFSTPPGSSSGDSTIPLEVFRPREALKALPTFFANGGYTILEDWVLMDEHFQEFPIVGYLRDRYDRIWFFVEGFGVGIGDLYTQRVDFYEIGLPDIAPRAIEYQGDDIWIGGIGRDRPGRSAIVRWPYREPGWDYFQARWISRLPRDDVNDIVADGDSVWFATEYGVSLYDANKNRWKNFNLGQGLTSNLVVDLEIMGDYVFAATDQGISRIDRLTGDVKKVKDFRLVNLPVHRMSAMGDTLWAATFRGIFRYIGSTDQWEFVPSGAAIQDIDITAVDAFQDEVWFASSSGIMRLNLLEDRWESFPQVGLEIQGPYEDIKADDVAVWVATREGLLKYDRERKSWRLFSRQDGLPDERCHQLMLDGDYIWIVTESGVTQFFWNSPNRID